MPAGEAFDVVVVRDPTMTVGAIMKLARDLAHLTGVKQAKVEEALQQGRFVVYPALASGRVEAAADQLRKMGAVVQLKPAQGAPGEASAGGFGGPVADFGGLNLDSGAFNTGSGLLAPTGFDDGIGRVLPSDDARTNRYEPVSGSGGSQRSLSDAEMRELVNGLEPSPVSLGTSEPDELEALALGLDAASLDSPSVQTIDGMDGAAFEAAQEAAKKEAAPVAATPPPAADGDAELGLEVEDPHPSSSTSSGHGPPPEASIQLDRPHQSSSSLSGAALPPPKMTNAAYSGTAPVPPYAAASRHDMTAAGDRGLLLEDPIGNTLGLIAASCLVCLIIAVGVTRATKRSKVTALEGEVAESYRSPYEVERGEMRPPQQIEKELEELYGSARFQFLVVLVLGVPIGLGLGRIRR